MKHTSRTVEFASELPSDVPYTYVATIGNSVYARARRSDGVPLYVERKYTPTYFLPTSGEGDALSYDGRPLASHMCDNISDGKDFLEDNPDAYGNIQPEYMFLSDIYGSKVVPFDMDNLYVWNFDIEVARDAIRGFAPPEDPFNPITAITVKWRHLGKSGEVVYGLKDYTPKEDELYLQFADEKAMLKTFIADFRGGGDYPDIITGYNVNSFDVPYLYKRACLLFGEKFAAQLSPFERVKERNVAFYQQDRLQVELKGVPVLDFYELYRKFAYSPQESYRLDHIAHVELKRRKLSYTEYRSLQRLYEETHQLFIEYNIQDVRLVDELEAKRKLIELVCALAYDAKVNFEDTYKQVRLWDVMIYHRLRADGKQIPPRSTAGKTEQYAGAYVKDPLVGLHEWVVSFDVASMYPHIIREWNLSPEMMVNDEAPDDVVQMIADLPPSKIGDGDEVRYPLVDALLTRSVDTSSLKSAGMCLAANSQLTRRETEGFLPNMLKTLYEERNRFKKMANAAKKELEVTTDPERRKQLVKNEAAYNNQQLVRKVNLNSAYGALGSNYFRFYDIRLAEAVTLTGQYAIRQVANDLNAFLNRALKTNDDYVIASDTDSVYLNLGPVVARFMSGKEKAQIVSLLDQFCKQKLEPIIEKTFEGIADYLNVFNPCMTMAREVIADKGVWTAKKRYILNVHNSEGVAYNPPKLKIMGIEAVKSSTPQICRDMIKKSLDILMNGKQEDLWSYIEQCRVEFNKATFEEVSFPRGVNDLAKYSRPDAKGIPIQVRGALAFNRKLERDKLTTLYEPIHDGEKIKFVHLREPNVFHTHVLSAPGGCPPEWNVEKWINYDKQFQGAFLDPLMVILGCAGWTVEHEDSLFD